MNWVWVFVTVIAGTVGDLLNAKGMVVHGEIEDFGLRGLKKIVRHIFTERLVILGMIADALSFVGLLVLLATTDLAFAVPVTALSTVLKTGLARWYLDEDVTWRRWAGAILVAAGIVLISL
ncbi:MAG TPA: EamA family transporter [Vicinamibacterales bacterium]|jgi:drug/metabolite transporter (DMT)-like permease